VFVVVVARGRRDAVGDQMEGAINNAQKLILTDLHRTGPFITLRVKETVLSLYHIIASSSSIVRARLLMSLQDVQTFHQFMSRFETIELHHIHQAMHS
jgi:hypothetical protein